MRSVEALPDGAYKRESHLKAAVIDRVLDSGLANGDTVLVTEMVVANWARRADIVLANGRLWAFEIKSETDKLDRLCGQVDTFRRYFEKVVIVAALKFEGAIYAMVPTGVGLWIVQSDGSLTQRIAPRSSVLPKESYISLMTASELRDLLAARGEKPVKSASRSLLQRMATELPKSDLAKAARESVKRRHKDRYLDFIGQRASIGTLAAIGALRRSRDTYTTGECSLIESGGHAEELFLSPDHPQFFLAPGGPVLKRAIS